MRGVSDNLRLPRAIIEQRIDMDQQCIRMLLHCLIECLLQFCLGAGGDDDDLYADAVAGASAGIGSVRILGLTGRQRQPSWG